MEVRSIDANALVEKLDNINPVDYGAMSSYETHNGARDALSDAIQCVNDAPTLSLNTLRDAIYQDAVAHGLWEGVFNLENAVTPVGEEAIELVESAIYAEENRNAKGEIESENWKNFEEELADTIISCMSVAGKLGIDIDAAIRRKMEINKGRPWKHGKE